MSQDLYLIAEARIPDQDWGPSIVVIPMNAEYLQWLVDRDLQATDLKNNGGPVFSQWSDGSSLWLEISMPDDLLDHFEYRDWIFKSMEELQREIPELWSAMAPDSGEHFRSSFSYVTPGNGMLEFSATAKHSSDEALSPCFVIAELVQEFEAKAGVSIQKEPDLAELQGSLQQAGIDGVDLDGLVHELKSREASEINNAGVAEQIRFIVRTSGVDILRELLERPKGQNDLEANCPPR